MSLESLLRHGFAFGPTHKADPDSATFAAQGIQSVALQIVNTYAQAVKEAADDPNLSPAGRTKEQREAGRAAIAAIKELAGSPAATRIAELLTRAEAALDKSVPGDIDSPAQAVREWEVRERLDAMDKSERLAAVRRAANAGDMLVINAIRNAPSIVKPYLPADTMDAVIGEMTEKRAPDRALALRTAREASVVAGKSIADVTAAITTAAHLTPDTATRIRSLETRGDGAAA